VDRDSAVAAAGATDRDCGRAAVFVDGIAAIGELQSARLGRSRADGIGDAELGPECGGGILRGVYVSDQPGRLVHKQQALVGRGVVDPALHDSRIEVDGNALSADGADAGQDEVIAGDDIGALTEPAGRGPVLAGAAVQPAELARVWAWRAAPRSEQVVAADG